RPKSVQPLQPNAMSYSIFISYRREDSQAAVSSLYKNLLDRFGKNAVFADTASIESGEAWSERIGKTLEEAKLILVVIGDNWLCAEKDDRSGYGAKQNYCAHLPG